MQDTVKLIGSITLELFDAQGQLKTSRHVRNIVTNAGRQAIIDRLQAASVAVCDYIAIGTGTAAAAAADTTLGTEAARAQGTLSQPDAHTDRCVYTFAAGTGTGAITECGRLNAASNGTLMGRQVFAAVNKGASDSLQVTYDFTYAAS
jgi:hypothetical protein